MFKRVGYEGVCYLYFNWQLKKHQAVDETVDKVADSVWLCGILVFALCLKDLCCWSYMNIFGLTNNIVFLKAKRHVVVF